jgi:DNA-binding HxlR family transcriptional regulator
MGVTVVRWSEIGDQRCSVARTLSVIGERWTLLVLREAFLRTRRFDDFQRLTGAPRPILADRLRTLVDQGILERRPYGTHPDRHEYRLTDKGLDLYPVIVSLMDWGDRWMPDDLGPPVVLEHRSCGHEICPLLACPVWVEPVVARDMRATVPDRMVEAGA